MFIERDSSFVDYYTIYKELIFSNNEANTDIYAQFPRDHIVDEKNTLSKSVFLCISAIKIVFFILFPPPFIRVLLRKKKSSEIFIST
jgi:hypothetical protein